VQPFYTKAFSERRGSARPGRSLVSNYPSVPRMPDAVVRQNVLRTVLIAQTSSKSMLSKS